MICLKETTLTSDTDHTLEHISASQREKKVVCEHENWRICGLNISFNFAVLSLQI